MASQIFELHNTRGLKLTETEKVKALLMKTICLNSATREEAEENVKDVQKNFAEIFKYEEKASESWIRGDLPLDSILMYHLRAVEDGFKEDDFSFPQSIEGERGSFEYVKEKILELGNDKKAILIYARTLAFELQETMHIISNKIPVADEKDPVIGDSLLLDKNGSLIFLLRAFRVNDEIDFDLVKKWENFLMNYEIISRSGFFYRKRYLGNFESIYRCLKPKSNYEECKNLLKNYYQGQNFGSGWKHLGDNAKKLFSENQSSFAQRIYGWHKLGYFLYKYEVDNGGSRNSIREEIFKDNSVSIDHIVARGLSWENLGYHDFENLSDEEKLLANNFWDKEIGLVINGIGNLALSTASSNSSDSNGIPTDHIPTYEKSGLSKTADFVKKWSEPKDFPNKINERSEDILKYISEKIIDRRDLWD